MQTCGRRLFSSASGRDRFKYELPSASIERPESFDERERPKAGFQNSDLLAHEEDDTVPVCLGLYGATSRAHANRLLLPFKNEDVRITLAERAHGPG